MNNVNKIIASQLCYGCGTCNVVCGHQAITMQYDNIGRLLPVVNEDICVSCGLCRNFCPSLDVKGIQLPDVKDKFVGHIEKVYIGKATDKRIYENSQSGGLVTATIKYLFESGKIDAAIMCRVDDAIEYNPKAVVITSPEDLFSCQKSSYVPIDIVSEIKQVERFNAIAVVGTGCHIQGIRALQNFNKKYKEKIKYTLGLICDRTLCKTVTDVLYDGHYENVSKRLIWRDKTLSYKNARILIRTTDQRTVQVPTWKRHVLKDSFTNPRCRICFDKLNTHADIVFGDPWGMSNVDWERGQSVVITRTSQGTDVVSNLLNDFRVELEEASLTEFVLGQHIEKRKKDVSSVLAYYQKKGWLTPSYSNLLYLTQEDPRLNTKIESFVQQSSLTKDAIVKKNILLLKKQRIKYYIKKILKFPLGKS